MAGSRQHFIPRMLLKRFADGADRVKVVSRERATFVTSIVNVALENKFFGSPGPGTADEAITSEEGRISALLNSACSSSPGWFPAEDAAVLFSHFAVRTRSTRSVIGQVGEMAIDAVTDLYSDQERARATTMQYLREHPESLMDEVFKVVRQLYGDGADMKLRQSPEYPQVVGVVMQWAESHLDGGALDTSFSALLAALGTMKERLNPLVRGAHERIARDGPTPTKRVETFEAFSYETREVSEGLVLGDSVAFCFQHGGGVTPILFNEDETATVIMPISGSRVLLGWRDTRPELDRESVVDGAFRSSEDFVVMHPSMGNLEAKQGLIGAASAEALGALKGEASEWWSVPRPAK
jgi:hypothetical protein